MWTRYLAEPSGNTLMKTASGDDDSNPEATTVRIHRRGYVSKSKKHGCLEPATLITEKVDGAGRHIRQIELCPRHCEVVIESARASGFGDQRPAR